MLPVAIWCGGRGTRLHSLTRDRTQKCLYEVAGRPFLDWKLDSLRLLGFTQFCLLTGHHAEQVEAAYPDIPCVRHFGRGRFLRNYWWTYGDSLVTAPATTIESLDYATVYTSLRINDNIHIDYGLILDRGTASTAFWEVTTPFYDINTPESLHRTEEHLCRYGLTALTPTNTTPGE